MKPKLIILEGSNQISIKKFKKEIIEKEKIDEIQFFHKNEDDNVFFNLYDLSLSYMNFIKNLELKDSYLEHGFMNYWVENLLNSPVCNNQFTFPQFLTNISELLKPSYKSAFNFSISNFNFIQEYCKKKFEVFSYIFVYPLQFESLIKNRKDFYENKKNFLYQLSIDFLNFQKIENLDNINTLKEELGIKYE